MPFVEATDVSKSFPSPIPGAPDTCVIDKLSFKMNEGELVTLFGPNGCGKTTILNLLAGTIEPDSGRLTWNNNGSGPVTVGYVFQNYSDTLLPWRTVRSNIAFPLEVRRMPKKEIAEKAHERMKQLGLTEHADKYIYQLSGGLKQLVAVARSTVYEPRLLLLDEPFSAMDYSVSRMIWTRFREYWASHKVTTVFVSHNVDEALFLGDRVLVLSSRPARVVLDLDVDFGNARSLDLLTSEQFFSARAQVLSAFEQGRSI